MVGLLELSGQTKRAALPMRMEIGVVYLGESRMDGSPGCGCSPAGRAPWKRPVCGSSRRYRLAYRFPCKARGRGDESMWGRPPAQHASRGVRLMLVFAHGLQRPRPGYRDTAVTLPPQSRCSCGSAGR